MVRVVQPGNQGPRAPGGSVPTPAYVSPPLRRGGFGVRGKRLAGPERGLHSRRVSPLPPVPLPRRGGEGRMAGPPACPCSDPSVPPTITPPPRTEARHARVHPPVGRPHPAGPAPPA